MDKLCQLLEEYHQRLAPLRELYPNYNLHPDHPDYEICGRRDYERFREAMRPHWKWLVEQIAIDKEEE